MNLNRDSIKVLDEIIACVNNVDCDLETYKNNLYLISQKISSDDFKLLLSLLKKVNKTNTTKAYRLVCEPQKTAIHNSSLRNISYTEEHVLENFYSNSDKEMETQYNLVQLKGMYDTIYSRGNKKPLVPKSKKEIIKAIRNYIYSIERSKMFKA